MLATVRTKPEPRDALPTSPWRGEVDARSASGGGDGDSKTTASSPHPGACGADPPPPGEGETDAGPKTSGPERFCVVERVAKPIEEMLRFVAGPDETLVPDLK